MNGIHAEAAKVEAVQQAPAPKNITGLWSFLGLLNYYGKFVPSLSTLLQLLQGCTPCQKVQKEPAKAPLHPWLWLSKPGHGPFRNLLAPFSGTPTWLWLMHIQNGPRWWTCHLRLPLRPSNPRLVVLSFWDPRANLWSQTMDLTQFASSYFTAFCRLNGIKHIHISPYHPSSNVFAECYDCTFIFKLAMK